MSRAIGEIGPPLLKPFTAKKGPRPMKKENKERKAKQEERNFGLHGAWIRLQPCIVADRVHPVRRTPCQGRIECAHLKCRQMGGCGGDRFSTFPACEKHHTEQEGKSAKFQERFGLDLAVQVELYCVADPGLTDDERAAAKKRLAKLREPR